MIASPAFRRVVRYVAFGTLWVSANMAQNQRDAYHEAFKAWRQADSNLERDASTNFDLTNRVTAQAAAAAKYSTLHAAYLRGLAAQANASLQALNSGRTIEPDLASALDLQRLVAASTEQVTTQVNTYTDDPDPALAPVRQALAKERSALVALSSSISERQSAVTKAASAWIAVEQARVKAVEPYQAMAGALQSSVAAVDAEAAAWTEYYKRLGEGTRATPATASTPTNVGGVRINNPARTPVTTADGVRINNPAGSSSPVANNPPVTSAPGSAGARFAGQWTFPMAGGMYHGPQPDVVDLVIRDDGGNLSGTMNARFWPAGEIKQVTTLRFTFSGPVSTSRVQNFPLVTSDGVKGTIDIIPGPAFNLIEINFFTEKTPGKVTSANMLLVRK